MAATESGLNKNKHIARPENNRAESAKFFFFVTA